MQWVDEPSVILYLISNGIILLYMVSNSSSYTKEEVNISKTIYFTL